MSEDDVNEEQDEKTEEMSEEEEEITHRVLNNMTISNLKFSKIFTLFHELIEEQFSDEHVTEIKQRYGQDAIPWVTDLPVHHKNNIILDVEAIKIDINEQNRGQQPINERGQIFASIELLGEEMARYTQENYQKAKEQGEL